MISEEDLKDFYKELARKRNIGENQYEEGITLNGTSSYTQMSSSSSSRR